VIANSQHRFTSVESCVTNPFAFYAEMAGYVDKGKMMVVFFILTLARYLTRCLIVRLVIYRLNSYLIIWVENWLDKQVSSGTKPS